MKIEEGIYVQKLQTKHKNGLRSAHSWHQILLQIFNSDFFECKNGVWPTISATETSSAIIMTSISEKEPQI